MFIFGKFNKIRLIYNMVRFFSILSVKTTKISYFVFFVYFLFFIHISILFAQPSLSEITLTAPQTSESLFREVVFAVESCVLISANIRHQINLFDTEITGTGRYIEVNQELSRQMTSEDFGIKFRLELNLLPKNVENKNIPTNTLLVVCDKQSIWKYTSINGTNVLTRTELKPVFEAIRRSGRNDISSEISSLYNFGGMTGMLRGIQQNYVFQSPPLKEQITDKFGSFNILRIQGELKPSMIEKVNAQKKSGAPTEQMPTRIDIYVKNNSYFPFRFDYYWSKNPETGSNGVFFARTEYYDIKLNTGEISDEEFIYRPDEIPADATQSYINQILQNSSP